MRRRVVPDSWPSPPSSWSSSACPSCSCARSATRGRDGTRIELGDERAIVVGVLAALAWLVWARFVLAVAMAVPSQVAELRHERDRVVGAPVRARPRRRQPAAGVGLVAGRLVAAALVLLPIAVRSTPVAAVVPLLPATAGSPRRGGAAAVCREATGSRPVRWRPSPAR